MMADQEQDQEGLPPGFKEELLQQLSDGTVVLTSDMQGDGEVVESMVTDDGQETQQIVEEIIGETHEGEELTQQIQMDEDGNAQLVTTDGNGMQDLITLHAVDSQGNLITDAGEVMEDGTLTDHVGIAMEQGGMELMHETIAEEVIATDSSETPTGQTEEMSMSGDMTQEQEPSSRMLNMQGSVFNPDTATFQTVSEVNSNSTAQSPQLQKIAPKKSPKPQPKKSMTKYIITQPGVTVAGSTQPQQQIILDANSLQNLLQGGGNITLATNSGKNVFISPSNSPMKKQTKSPAKILPAPVPVGDQQQAGGQRIMINKGGVLTPIAPANQLSESKLLQVSTSSGNQYIRVVPKGVPGNKIPIAPATSKPKLVTSRPGQTIILPAGSNADLSSLQNSQGLGNIVVLPNYVQQVKSENTPIPIRPHPDTSSASSPQVASILTESGLNHSSGGSGNLDSFRSLLEPNGMRPRKPCNCTKSQCLKLYCDCFANGEFCHLCNCSNCFNNLNHEEDRQKAIKLVLERNPGAFRPKIGKSSTTGEAHERRHNKGCNCRRSGCLKNYCECYEAKIFCSGICKCTGCKNCIENIPSGLPNGVGVEQHFAGAGTSHRQTLKDLAEAAEVRVQQQNQVKNKMRAQLQEMSPQNNLGIQVPPLVFKYPNGSISYEVVTSTVELLLAKTEAAEKQKMSEGEIERIVLEEFGECLSSIMELGTTIPCQDNGGDIPLL